ncbi:aminopeptidase N [Pedococcus sp. 5OH_020]|uniref:aminopeptidase N n=1 Tax=Pedococcus sp. 5OH_020 TaxID=2989814 RepID=UPI0022E9E2A2|nr:aminopeptidase N [Pedococcus sp. 5OH_020]
MPSLTRAEARARSALVRVTHMAVDLDLDQGEELFLSRSTIEFTCTEPGSTTFLDVRPVELRALVLNGEALAAAAVRDGRMELPGLRDTNVLEVHAVMSYSRDGQGLHRAADPADGEHYVYGHLFLDAAPRVFGCFDQPDLKAPYTLTVTAPTGWVVLGNGAATQVLPGRWQLATTLPLATYFVTVCAGPYASVRDEHDGIPLGVHARASLREALEREAPQMFDVTKAGLDYYHSLFGIRYPFGEYHQVFVPEFNAGAMENPGCVTLRDTYVFRGAAARDELLSRSSTITHEMAHMWFGDLVTMQWWDDLWLNESFAEYMAHRTCVEATEFTDAWVDSTVARKPWGYAAERAPSTHPVAGSPALDAHAALQDFDGISYAKGSAALRQLIEHVGDGAFISGVSAYLREHSFGNGTLAEFIDSMQQASGRELTDWTRGWLLTAGVDVLAYDREAGVLERSAPHGLPADRPHSLDIAGFTQGRETCRVAISTTGDRTAVPSADVLSAAELVVPNASDLTWATVVLDSKSAAVVPLALGDVPDPQARAVVWVALIDGLCLGAVDPRLLVETFANAWPREVNDSILSRTATALLSRVVPMFLPEREQDWAHTVVARAATAVLTAVGTGSTGSTRAVVAARTVARSTDDEGTLRAWAAGRDRPAGVTHDDDFGWIAIRNLASRGLVDDAFVEQAAAADHTLQGRLSALTARASMPSTEAKEWAWTELTANRNRSNYELNALAQGFWLARDLSVVRPYVPRYFSDVPAMTAWVGDDALARVATLAYPARVTEEATLLLSQRCLLREDLSPAVRRAVVDCQSELTEALRSRAAFG